MAATGDRDQYDRLLERSGLRRERRSGTVTIEFGSAALTRGINGDTLRSTAVGACLANLLAHLGHDVVTIHQFGDWCSHFGFIRVACQRWGPPATPSIESLLALYQRAVDVRKAQDAAIQHGEPQPEPPSVSDQRWEYFRALESGVPEAVEFWQSCRSVFLQELEDTFALLGIRIQEYVSEAVFLRYLPELDARLQSIGALDPAARARPCDVGDGASTVFYNEAGEPLPMMRELAMAIHRYRSHLPCRSLYAVRGDVEEMLVRTRRLLDRMDLSAGTGMEAVSLGGAAGLDVMNGGIPSIRRLLDRGNAAAKRNGATDGVCAALTAGSLLMALLSVPRRRALQFSWPTADFDPMFAAYQALNGAAEAPFESGCAPTADQFGLSEHLIGFEQMLTTVERDLDPADLVRYTTRLIALFEHAVAVDRSASADRAQLSDTVAAGRYVLRTCIGLLTNHEIARSSVAER